jgi:hypothetical protein
MIENKHSDKLKRMQVLFNKASATVEGLQWLIAHRKRECESVEQLHVMLRRAEEVKQEARAALENAGVRNFVGRS